MLGPVGNTIKDKLASTFAPVRLEVIDESHHHAGHSGARPDGESHFRVEIVAEAFRGKSRVDQHRMVNAALADLLRDRVHALAIQASAPVEDWLIRLPPAGGNTLAGRTSAWGLCRSACCRASSAGLRPSPCAAAAFLVNDGSSFASSRSGGGPLRSEVIGDKLRRSSPKTKRQANATAGQGRDMARRIADQQHIGCGERLHRPATGNEAAAAFFDLGL